MKKLGTPPRSTGHLPQRIADWCDWQYRLAKIAANARMALHPNLFRGGEIEDWRNHMPPVCWQLIEAAMAARVWTAPPSEDDPR